MPFITYSGFSPTIIHNINTSKYDLPQVSFYTAVVSTQLCQSVGKQHRNNMLGREGEKKTTTAATTTTTTRIQCSKNNCLSPDRINTKQHTFRSTFLSFAGSMTFRTASTANGASRLDCWETTCSKYSIWFSTPRKWISYTMNHCRTTKAALGWEIKYMTSVCICAHLCVDARRERMSERQHFI